ncbi:protein kinase PINOID 2 isoform X1 [Arabidopsis lyrata subsp. lyrata]|uniref:protein kinase PINOID 2 isoform X1 n=1 Tax=Arabidopsis lyrata subsp. lyrata TaxID=81972 RepID=UPI000A29E6D7|nr:protein kinase PINOID 2 isoform X1 [Arabidopsis lyrata subsp. lyrata]|eukprot:XP_020885766.1 protein kinase PINOID 2 isoform X1 [Arabidopsis lyrata subsp. lyrata]
MANSSIFYKDNESDYESSTAGPDSSRRTSWLSSSFTASPSCSSISHLSNNGLNNYNQSKPHKANQVAWEAMARLRRCCGRAVGLEHFRLLKRLGSGDIGSVYLCQIRGSPETAFYAMKVVDKEAVAVKKKLGRAEMEKKILGMLDHPFCPTLYAAFEASHYSFLVMEYCPGGDLYAARLRQPSKRFTISSTRYCGRFYAAETLVALEYLHMMGIVYRDLKPENVLIREDGHVMLSDFDLSFKCDVVPQLLNDNDRDRGHQGDDEDISIRRKCSTPSCTATPLNPVISCFSPTSSRRRKKNVVTTTIHENAAGTSHTVKSNDVSRTFSRSPSSCSRVSNGLRDISGGCPSIFAEPINARSKSFVGTHEYLAPEVISGQGHGSAVDWWTYGIFLYEMIFGRTPFKGENNEKTLVNILKAPLTFPKVIVNSPKEYEDMVNAQDLIIKLLVKNPKKRLGSLKGSIEIKRHEFFEGVNWALIRSIKPPWVPKEETSHKTKGDNRSVNYYLPPRFMMSRKERDEPYHVANHFDYF